MPETKVEKKYELNFPPEFGELVIMLIKKYELGPTDPFSDPATQQLLQEAQTPEERLKIFKDLPLDKIIDVIREMVIKEIPTSGASLLFQTRLGIPEKIANNLAQDVEKILPLVEKIPIEEAAVPEREYLPRKEIRAGEGEIGTKASPYAPPAETSAAPRVTQKSDTYREALEE